MTPASSFSAINVMTPVGNLYLQSSPDGLRRCAFLGNSEAHPFTDFFSARPEEPLLEQAVEQLGEYFQGTRQSFSLPLNLSGLPDFQTRVLIACAAIPWGETRTYAQLANVVGTPGASARLALRWRATRCCFSFHATAVIASDGALRGFAAPDGIRTKPGCCSHEGLRVENENQIQSGEIALSELIPGYKSGFVSIVGKPNARKKAPSPTACLGSQLPASPPKPQTTRKRQLAILTTDEAQIIFVDTPGLHEPKRQTEPVYQFWKRSTPCTTQT
jgi:methylated-DNA-[protein]-cysteine S-methyltransferase